ncbi:ABC transporter ATP-binding protein [Aureimonas sp. AU4]|uniref:ABC transporter ATP-binding protein n=1 Tax=Aureimonas sp. AU4 TaxID=1638163 RepID=UPI000785262C|nr:ABC transporter ATP-binding protein [Aureimonas sp. AU4]
MTLLALRDVRFSYAAGRPVLGGVDLEVGAGEAVGLVGESGSGKTTLLRLALGLAKPTAGTVRFRDVPLDPRDRRQMRAFRRSVQVVFQDPYGSLDPRQRVRAIVAEPLRSLGVEGDHGALVAEALRAVGLEPDAAARFPHQFSGGQRQRIAIARAIVAGPELLLADEALSALDLTTRIRILDLLRELRGRMAILFVSHDIGAVAALCDRVVILEQGRIVEAGPTGDVLARPAHPYTRRLLASVPRLVAERTPNP